MGAKRKGLDVGRKADVLVKEDSAPFENPLVPHETLRQMYRKMVELRVLEEEALGRRGGLKAGRKLEPSRSQSGQDSGQEACRVSLMQGLGAGDVVLEAREGRLTGYLLGTKAAAVLRGMEELSTGGEMAAARAALAAGAGLLPFVEGAEARLFAAVGAGLLLKATSRKNAVVVYVDAAGVAKEVWRRVLPLAARLELPILFVALRRSARSDGKGTASKVSRVARESGVPGIPVDASDAVALYRVAQESMGRMRGEGGPVLVECMTYRVADRKKGEKAGGGDDPIEQLKGFLLGRKVCTQAWMDEVEGRFRKGLGAKKR